MAEIDTKEVEPLAVDAAQVATMLSICKSHFYSMLSSGQIGPMAMKLGKRSLYSVKELDRWVEAGMPPRQKWIEQKKMINSQNVT